MNTLVLYDIEKDREELIQEESKKIQFFYASEKTARCKGCFGCWLKSPGQCIMHDGAEKLGAKMAVSERIIIISKNLYGGFSVEIKRLLDRAISYSLPFFEVRDGKLHHKLRYPSAPYLSVYFYETEKMTPEEKTLSKQIVRANAVNYNAALCETYFIKGKIGVEEVLRLEDSNAKLQS